MRIKPIQVVGHTGLTRSVQQPRVWLVAVPRIAAGCPVYQTQGTLSSPQEAPLGGAAPQRPHCKSPGRDRSTRPASCPVPGPCGLVPVTRVASDPGGSPRHLATMSFFRHVPLPSLPCQGPRLTSGSSNSHFRPCPLPPGVGPCPSHPREGWGQEAAHSTIS